MYLRSFRTFKSVVMYSCISEHSELAELGTILFYLKKKKKILIFFIDLKKKKNSMVPNSASIKVQQSTAL